MLLFLAYVYAWLFENFAAILKLCLLFTILVYEINT